MSTCPAADCPRHVFAERLPTVAAPRVRRTGRLAEAQRTIALSAGGVPGAQMATRLAMPVSGDTLLRLVRAEAVAPIPAPRVIGIDDWAWRLGKRSELPPGEWTPGYAACCSACSGVM